MFEDRRAAGVALARELSKLDLKNPVVLALPRGGVPVAAEIAQALGAPLDVVIVRKVGAPGNPELALAALVDGNPPDIVLNREIVEVYGLDDEALSHLIEKERPELQRRREVYRGNGRVLSIAGKTAILVDDGAATGTTMKVAIRALKRRSPASVVVALPVAPSETVAELSRQADKVVCLGQPSNFHALGYYYRNFDQLADASVIEMLSQARQIRKAALSSRRKREEAKGGD